MPIALYDSPRIVRVCGFCLDEGREEPRVRPCDEVDYGTCDRHARRIRRALSVPLDAAGEE